MKLLQMIDIDEKQNDLQRFFYLTICKSISQLLLSTSQHIETILTTNFYQNFLLIAITFLLIYTPNMLFAYPKCCNSEPVCK